MTVDLDLPRVALKKVTPQVSAAMGGLHAAAVAAATEAGLEPALLELVRIRASQINGCAFCIDMHTKDARAAGETEQRLYALSAWRETPFFTDRERAALAVTEALTLVATSHDALGEAIEAAKDHFDAAEMAKLTYLIVTINAWNRLAITAAGKVGGYVAGTH